MLHAECSSGLWKAINATFKIITIHISLFLDEIKMCILFPSKGFAQWNSILLAYLHSVRVLRLSANVKFACNIVRIFNSERDFLAIFTLFFRYTLAQEFWISRISVKRRPTLLRHESCLQSWSRDKPKPRPLSAQKSLHCYHAYSIVTSVGFQKSCCNVK